MVRVKIAEICIEVNNRYEYFEHMVKDYLTDETPELFIGVSNEDIDAEIEQAETICTPQYAEFIAIYRKIAEAIYMFDGIVFHGCALAIVNEGYIITARRGVGKTTHSRLWRKAFADSVRCINGDKPIVRFIEGVPYVYGTPWMGKEGYGANDVAELRGIAFLERAEKNTAEPISVDDAVMKLMTQIYLPKNDRIAAMKTLSVIDRLTNSVKKIKIKCNMDVDAAKVCLDGFRNLV